MVFRGEWKGDQSLPTECKGVIKRGRGKSRILERSCGFQGRMEGSSITANRV